MNDQQRTLIEKLREEDRERQRAAREEYDQAPIGPDGLKRDWAGRIMHRDGHRYWDTDDGPAWRPDPPAVPHNPRDALPQLMEFATALWEDIVMIGADPVRLMRYREDRRSRRKVFADWVGHLEQLVRSIILLAALTLAPQSAQRVRARARTIPPYRRQWPDDPLTWQVSFSVLHRPSRPSRHLRSKPGTPPHARDVVSVVSLARRMEALRRAISYMSEHAKRCRRTLDRIEAKNRRSNTSPRTLFLRPFDFFKRPRTHGGHAAFNGMKLAHVIAVERAELWNARQYDPG